MLRGMYSSISAMINLQANQSVISNNMANINTTGYKSETLVYKSFDEIMLSNKDKYINGESNQQEIGNLNPGVKIDEIVTNYSQGTIVETDSDTDFAIVGKGFFTTIDKDGNTAYTRDGVFTIDSSGYLMSASGENILGINQITNKVEPIYVGNKKVSVDNNNNLLLDSKITYKFSIVDFENYNELTKVGQNLFKGENPIVTNDYKLKNRVKESSNVDMIDATSALMTNLRAFEANQKVIQTMDSTLSKIANEIGTVR